MRHLVTAALLLCCCAATVRAADDLTPELRTYDFRRDNKDMIFLSFEPSRLDSKRGEFSIYITTGKKNGTSQFYAGTFEKAPGRPGETVLQCKTQYIKLVADGLKDKDGKSKALTFPLKEEVFFRMKKESDKVIAGSRLLYLDIRYESKGLKLGSWKQVDDDNRFHAMKKNQ